MGAKIKTSILNILMLEVYYSDVFLSAPTFLGIETHNEFAMIRFRNRFTVQGYRTSATASCRM